MKNNKYVKFNSKNIELMVSFADFHHIDIKPKRVLYWSMTMKTLDY